MLLTHWSEKPLGRLRNVNPSPCADFFSAFRKPRGLWLSDESGAHGWSSWCESEDFPLGSVQTHFLVDMSAVLHLKDAQDINDFTEEWGKTINQDAPLPAIAIDWKRVGNSFKGVLITPYVWECRLDLRTRWYYGWDCASGCFWDVSCLTRVSLAVSA